MNIIQGILSVAAAIVLGVGFVTLASSLHGHTKRTSEEIQRDRDIDSARRKAEIYNQPKP